MKWFIYYHKDFKNDPIGTVYDIFEAPGQKEAHELLVKYRKINNDVGMRPESQKKRLIRLIP